MPRIPQLMTASQVAQRLGCTPRHVVRIAGLVPVMRLPGPTGAHLYNPDDVDRIAADRNDDEQ